MKKVFLNMLISVLTVALVFTMFPLPAFATEGEESGGDGEQQKAKRTILLYDCGSDLETEAGLASYNLRQILSANFSADEDVRFIVMTGGADKWHLENDKLVFPEDVYVPDDAVCVRNDDREPLDPDDPDQLLDPKSSISNTYNQIWEAKGMDAAENAGKMVLLDGDGVLGDGENAKRSIIDVSGGSYVDGEWEYDYDNDENYEWMIDPEVLKAFIDFGVDNYPADKYDLILWDHGMGPDGGFCSDLHESGHGFDSMGIHQLAKAFAENKVVDPDGDGTPDSKFDLINFDACLMNSVEIDLAFADYTDYYIASPETEPGYGQDYEGWMNMVGEDPEVNTFELGKKIVDDFVAFYDKESGDGCKQDGTLAVIDMNKLMKTTITTPGSSEPRGFVDALTELSEFMQMEVRDEGLYYDEFRSFKSSICYGEQKMYDLGNVVSQLAYVFDEADYEDVDEEGNFNDQNSYSDTANVLLSILNDKDIVYARGTEGIHTNEQFYRSADGSIKKGTQGTSGMFMCFDPLDNPMDPVQHHTSMNKIMRNMDENDKRVKLFKNLEKTMNYYGLVYYTGTTVTEMVGSGTDKDTIEFATLKDYWQTNTDKWGSPIWETIEPFIDALGGEESVKEWLEPIIRQQRDEGIIKDQIVAKSLKTDAGTGSEVTLNDIRKQAIDSLTMNVIAELPAVKEFADENQSYMDYNNGDNLPTDLVIGRISGKEVFDVDPLKDGYEKVIDWLFEARSTWQLDPAPDKWYAIKDAAGNIHAAAPFITENEIDIPAGYFTEERISSYDQEGNETFETMKVCNTVYLVFMKDSSGNWNLDELYFRDEMGGGRTIPVTEYKGTLELYSTIRITDDWSTFFLPISSESFTVSPETLSGIEMKYMDIKDIPDIADTDGDGRGMHATITVNNIYGQKTDITDVVNKAGESDPISIKDKKVVLSKTTFKYNGKVQKPTIKTIDGKSLKAGTDYTVKIKNSKGKVIKSPKSAGKYTITITGKGKYTGTTKATYEIIKAANTMKIKARTTSVKYSKLKKGSQTLKVSKVIRFVKKGQGKKTYTLVSAKKGKKSYKKYFKVNSKNGKVTVKKKLKKGTYKVRIKVKAASTTNHKSTVQKVTSTIKVR